MTAPASPAPKPKAAVPKPDPYVDHGEYASLRVVNLTDAGRTGGPVQTLLHGGPGRTIVLSCKYGSYWTFRIKETGIEIPVTNVASATPRGAPGATRVRRTDKIGIDQKREARLAKADARREAAAVKAEEIAKQKADLRAEKARQRAIRKQGWNDDDAEEGNLDG
jgi:hypothetical protein